MVAQNKIKLTMPFADEKMSMILNDESERPKSNLLFLGAALHWSVMHRRSLLDSGLVLSTYSIPSRA
jgi:hypothetical protein